MAATKQTSQLLRLDRFLVSTGKVTRSEAGRAIRAGHVTVNGSVELRADRHIAPETDCVTLHGENISYNRYRYILLHKPEGYVSATEDGDAPTVLALLPQELGRIGLFPCGRLDKYTTGLMLLTNDGELAHRLLSPRHHVEKSYFYTCRSPLGEAEKQQLETGVSIGEGYVTKPCRILPAKDGLSGIIILTEGKYHQIKRMFDAVFNKILTLRRETFANLSLPPELSPGEWRPLTPQEVTALREYGGI